MNHKKYHYDDDGPTCAGHDTADKIYKSNKIVHTAANVEHIDPIEGIRRVFKVLLSRTDCDDMELRGLVEACGEDVLKLAGQARDSIKEVQVYKEALQLACNSVAEWGAYASEFFQEKWNLTDDTDPETHLKDAREDIAKLEGNSGKEED